MGQSEPQLEQTASSLKPCVSHTLGNPEKDQEKRHHKAEGDQTNTVQWLWGHLWAPGSQVQVCGEDIMASHLWTLGPGLYLRQRTVIYRPGALYLVLGGQGLHPPLRDPST